MQNPFYQSAGAQTGAPPPAYGSRPGSAAPPPPARPAAPAAPAQYSSLADLTKNRPVPPPRPGKSEFSYTPDPSRQGYASPVNEGFSGGPSTGAGRGDGRRMPPPPSNQGLGLPTEPPRRYTSTPTAQSSTYEAAPPKPTGAASYIPASAQGYANTASSYATAGLGRAKEGLDSMMTQQRREQVTTNLGKAAAGGAKLLGRGAWQLGKFASNPTGK